MNNRTDLLRVPSVVISREKNYVLNVLNPSFRGITFGPSEPFHLDSRLKQSR